VVSSQEFFVNQDILAELSTMFHEGAAAKYSASPRDVLNYPRVDHNLGIFYSHQFIQNEKTSHDKGECFESVYQNLEHNPIVKGSLTGTIYRCNKAIKTFAVDNMGGFTFNDWLHRFTKISSPIYPTGGFIDLHHGEIRLTWNDLPGDNYLVVSYEYEMEC